MRRCQKLTNLRVSLQCWSSGVPCLPIPGSILAPGRQQRYGVQETSRLHLHQLLDLSGDARAAAEETGGEQELCQHPIESLEQVLEVTQALAGMAPPRNGAARQQGGPR